MPTTTNYALPYPASTAPPQVWVDMGNLAVATDTALAGVADTEDQSVFSATSVSPLVSAANTDTAVLTLAGFPFRSGFAYRLDYFFRFSMSGGTGPYNAFSKLKRATAAGTLIHDASNVAAIGTSNIMAHVGSCIVKCTAGNTTQTVVLTAAFTTTGSPTSMNISAATTALARLSCARIGTAADYPGALEIPTV